MSSVNKVILVGNIGRDPEIKTMQNGGRVCNLSVATSDRWKDKNTGEQQEKTEWHRVVIFDDRLCDVVERFLSKGSKVYLEGALQTRKWTDQSARINTQPRLSCRNSGGFWLCWIASVRNRRTIGKRRAMSTWNRKQSPSDG